MVGKDGNTIQVEVRQGGAKLKAVGFQMGSRKEEMLSGGGQLSLALFPPSMSSRGAPASIWSSRIFNHAPNPNWSGKAGQRLGSSARGRL